MMGNNAHTLTLKAIQASASRMLLYKMFQIWLANFVCRCKAAILTDWMRTSGVHSVSSFMPCCCCRLSSDSWVHTCRACCRCSLQLQQDLISFCAHGIPVRRDFGRQSSPSPHWPQAFLLQDLQVQSVPQEQLAPQVQPSAGEQCVTPKLSSFARLLLWSNVCRTSQADTW